MYHLTLFFFKLRFLGNSVHENKFLNEHFADLSRLDFPYFFRKCCVPRSLECCEASGRISSMSSSFVIQQRRKPGILFIHLREVAKKSFFPVVRPLRGGGVEALVVGPLKKTFLRLPLHKKINIQMI